MRQRTIAGLLAAVVLLAGIVIAQASRPAEAGGIASRGDPCPADIDDNGTVNVQDFLILLGSWGDCPGPPRVIEMALVSNDGLYRLWSDGMIERATNDAGDFCSGGVWCEWEEVPDDAPPQPNARVIQIASFSTGFLYRLWSNGVSQRNRTLISVTCPDTTPVEWCGWVTVSE